MKKYGLLLGDPHCGHLVGLTPPKWQVKLYDKTSTKRNKWKKISVELWSSFIKILKQLPPLDFVVANGDLVEGKGKRSGGCELISADMYEQTDMAVAILNKIREYGKKDMKIIQTFGTPYHTVVDGDEWERRIAEKAFVDKIGSHEWFKVNGVTFDIKHHIGSSGIPHGRYTSLAKDMLWNLLWAEMEMQPKADIIIRSHAHYWRLIQDSRQTGMILPALQGMGSRFGSKKCSGTVDWGCVLIEVTNKNNFIPHPFIRRILTQKIKVYEI